MVEEQTRVWMLLATETDATVHPVGLELYRGVSAQAIKVGLTNKFPADSDIRASSKVGAQLAYDLLWAEAYERASQRVSFTISRLDELHLGNVNIEGRSADLAFALSLIHEVLGGDVLPPLAATGRLGEKGEVYAVGKTYQKIVAALATLPANSVIVYPAETSEQLPESMHIDAAEKSIRLLAVNRLDEAASELGMQINNIHLASPFRGLQPFEYEHGNMFYGRIREIEEASTLLKSLGGILVIGASGTGKSSFVQAGLLPELVRRSPERHDVDFKWAIYKPRDKRSGEWLPSLLAAWAKAKIPESLLGDVSGQHLKQAAQQVSMHERQQLIFIIDQLEELFTQGYTESEITAFCEYLADLKAEGIWVIATLRNDFYPSFQASALSTVLTANQLYNLNQPDSLALEQIIDVPARLAGIRYEEKNQISLSAQIREDSTDEPGVLPLLEYTLTELYQLRDKQKNVLTYESYNSFGGIKGSIGQVAERVYLELDEPAQKASANLLHQLSRWDEPSQSFVSRSIVVEHSDSDSISSVIEKFSAVNVRLLIKDRVGQQVVLRVVHEALINHWPRAKIWASDDAEFRKWHARIEIQAKQWQKEGEIPPLLLSKGKPLFEADEFMKMRAEYIHPLIKRYIEASLKSALRSQRVRWSLVASVILSLSCLTLWAIVEKNKADEQRNSAVISQTKSIVASAATALSKKDTDKAMLLALNAMPGIYGGEDRPLVGGAASLLGTAAYSNQKKTYFNHGSSIEQLASSADGSIISTHSIKRNAIWNTDTGELIKDSFTEFFAVNSALGNNNYYKFESDRQTITIRSLLTDEVEYTLSHDSDVFSISFSRDGTRALVRTTDSFYLWSTQKQQVLKIFNDIDDAVLSPNGRYVLLTNFDVDNVTLYHDGSYDTIILDADETNIVMEASFSPDSRKVSLLTEFGALFVVDVKTGEQILIGEASPYTSGMESYEIFSSPVSFNYNGELIAAVNGNNVEIRSISDDFDVLVGKVAHMGAINDLGFTYLGDILTASSDWGGKLSYDDGEVRRVFNHSKPVNKIMELPGRRSILTASKDGTAVIWRNKAPNIINVLKHKRSDTVNFARFNVDGGMVLTKTFLGPAYVWDGHTGEERAKISIENEILDWASFFNNGKSVIAVSDKSISIWSVLGGMLSTFPRGEENNYIFPSQSGLEGLSLPSTGTGGVVLNLETGVKVSDINSKGQIRYASFYSNNTKLLTVSDKNIVALWSVDRGDKLASQEYEFPVVSASISPNEKMILAAGGQSISVRFINKTNHEVNFDHVGAPLFGAFFSDDGSYVLGLDKENNATVWNVSTKLSEYTFSSKGAIDGMSFTEDGQFTLGESGGNKVSIWDVATGNKTVEFKMGDRESLKSGIKNEDVVLRVSSNFAYIMKSPYPDIINFAINSLPKGRTCLTAEERKEFFFTELTEEERELRGCSR